MSQEMMSLQEYLARVLTARKMKLIHDPNGVQLPDHLWQRRLSDAKFIVGAIETYHLYRITHNFHMEDEIDGE